MPVVESLCRKEQVAHATTFVQGLLSDVDHKNVESIAYRFNQDRMPLQWFIDNQRVLKTDDYLSNAAPEKELQAFARVAKAEHRMEECIQRSKSEAGLGDYEVRNRKGWHHHQTLSLIATWFFVTESRRGKKWTPAITVQQIREGIALILHATCRCATTDRILYERERRLIRNELARFYHWKQRMEAA